MTVYYLGPGGNDGNPGTSWPLRWLTIGHANATLVAGDTVNVGAGTYAESIEPSNFGAAGNPITYQDYDGQHAVVVASASGHPSYSTCIYLDNKDYVVVDGFFLEVRGSSHIWGEIWAGSDHCTVRNCTCRTTASTTDYSGLHVQNSNYLALQNCRFERWGNYSTEGGDAVYLYNCDYCLLEENDWWDAQCGHSDLIMHGDYNVVRNNRFRNLWQKCVDAQGHAGISSIHNLFENNVFYDAHPASPAGKGRKGLQYAMPYGRIRLNIFIWNYGEGLTVQTWDGGGSDYTHDAYQNRIYANTFYKNGLFGGDNLPGIACYDDDPAGVMNNNKFYNNVLYNNNFVTNRQIYIRHQSGGLNNLEFRGNVIRRTGAGENTIQVLGIGTNTLAWFEANYPANFSNNDDVNPDFADGPGWDFNFAVGSPCLAGGVDLTTANGGGVGSTALVVHDARWFSYGNGIVDADWVKVGSAEPVQIASINYATNTVTLAAARTWNNGDAVNLYKDSSGNTVLAGAAPDVGRPWDWEDLWA